MIHLRRATILFIVSVSLLAQPASCQVDKSAVEIFIETILSGSDPSLLDAKSLNSTELVQKLDYLSRTDPDLYARFEDALVSAVAPAYEGNQVVVSECGMGSYIDPLTKLCTPCRAGTYSLVALSNSPGDCRPCVAGTYSAEVGARNASACQACAAGTFSTEVGANSSSTCRTCGAGSTSVAGAQGVESCVCVAGFYRDSFGSCVRCEEGFYCAMSVRNECPGYSEGKSTSPPGSNSSGQCLCRPGYYSFAYVGSGCQLCPPNFYCTGEQDVLNYGKSIPCPENSVSDMGSVSLDECKCQDSFRKQYSVPSQRLLTITATPCNCTNAKTPRTCSALDAPGCVGCGMGQNCDPSTKGTLTCKQGFVDVIGTNIPSSTSRSWIIAPAGALKVRVVLSKLVSASGVNFEQCITTSCATAFSRISYTGSISSSKNYETADGFVAVKVTWTSTGSTTNPMTLEYTSEIACDRDNIAARIDSVVFQGGATDSNPFQPDASWPIVAWIGDEFTFSQSRMVDLDLRQGSATGPSVLDPYLGLYQWVPSSVQRG